MPDVVKAPYPANKGNVFKKLLIRASITSGT